MATTEPTDDEADDANSVIVRAIEDSGWFFTNGDEVRRAEFNDSGVATAIVTFDSCISSIQFDKLADDEKWNVKGIHPDGLHHVHAHLIEVVE